MALKMAYSPTLILQESYVALYKIYVLRNPFDNSVFYVGQTLQELQTRLTGHIHQSGDVNQQKNEYIANLINKGAKPIIEAIETIPGTCRIDKALVNERKIYWIKYYKSMGVTLLNIANAHDYAECREYKNYLRSIKAGEGYYSYYYCGKTYGGHEVYDEKKMQADGFSLPPGESSIIKIIEKERIVEKVVHSIVYLEKPSVQTEYLPENGLEQPKWTRAFFLSIPADDSGYDFDEQEDLSDWEIESDFEPNSDAEPDINENDECDDEDDDPDENDDRDTFIVYSDLNLNKMFTYECKYCDCKMTGSFGDNVYCPNCNITFETDCDCNMEEEGGESWYAWLTSVEHKGEHNIYTENDETEA